MVFAATRRDGAPFAAGLRCSGRALQTGPPSSRLGPGQNPPRRGPRSYPDRLRPPKTARASAFAPARADYPQGESNPCLQDENLIS
jgi:hypothetical protein